MIYVFNSKPKTKEDKGLQIIFRTLVPCIFRLLECVSGQNIYMDIYIHIYTYIYISLRDFRKGKTFSLGFSKCNDTFMIIYENVTF